MSGMVSLNMIGPSKVSASRCRPISSMRIRSHSPLSAALMSISGSSMGTSPSFTGEHILGAILFEMTMDRTFGGQAAADYLWETKHVVPFLKVDKGLADEAQGVRLMKPIAGLDTLLERAKAAHIFGTKMRSLIRSADPDGIAANVAQKFELGRQIAAAGLVPILEPEIDIKAADKGECERILMDEIG